MNKRLTFGIIVGISVLAAVVFLSSSIFQETLQQEPIKITMHLWPGYYHSFIAQERGFFQDEGVNVELVINENIDDSLQYFKEGKADAAFGLQSDAMLLAAQGIDLQIVYVADFSNGGDVIVSKLDIKTIADLKGKTIGVDKLNGFNHIFLVELLRLSELKESDVTIVPIIASEVPDALDDGRIDAGQTWEPYESEAVAKGYRLLATSADAPGIITDVLMFDKEFVEQRPEDVKKILKSLFRALEFRDEDLTTSYAIMSEATGVSPGSLKRTIQGNIFPNLEENKEAFTRSEQPTSLYKSGEFISNFFVEKGVIDNPINLEDILATEIIKDLE